MSTAKVQQAEKMMGFTAVLRRIRESRVARALGFCLIIAFTLLPILNIIRIVVSTGANAISNDYVAYVQIVDQVLSGTYDWRHFFSDTFIAGAHCMALPMLVRLAVVKFASWDIYFELYIIIALALLKLILLHQSFTVLAPRASRWLLWPVLAALVFSTSQINVFTFGDAGLQVMLVQVGCALGMWGLVRFRAQWRGIGLMAAGGAIATLSGGGGLLAWPVFLIGLVLLGFRKASHYAAWFAVAAISSLPYVFFIVIRPTIPRKKPSLFNYGFIINSIGWPFTNNIGESVTAFPQAVLAGYLGVALVITGFVLLWAKRRTPYPVQATPGIMYVLLGLLGIWQTSLFRTNIAPWYTTAFMTFWIGLVGLGYVFWVNREPKPAGGRGYASILAPSWSVALAVILLCLYATSNIAYANKVFYLNSRGPAAAACLRNYRVAPTYCEQYLFQWGIGHSGAVDYLGKPLERHHLSVFAAHQEWTLQGDYVLDNVRIREAAGVPGVFWSPGLTGRPGSYADYKHLNLFLHTPNSISWRVSLPANVEQADFHSAVALSESAPIDPSLDGASFEVYVEAEGQSSQQVFQRHLAANQRDWQAFSIPLSVYAGRTIVLRLTSSGGQNNNGDWAMYRYPYIDVRVNPAKSASEDIPAKPFSIKPTAEDAHFDVTNPNQWQAPNMELLQATAGTSSKWRLKQDASLAYKPAIDICLADYTHFYARLGVSSDVALRSLQIFYKLKGQPSVDAEQSVIIPLYAGGDLHEYTFDLKLLFLSKGAHLTGLRLAPISNSAPSRESWAEIADLRLIRRDQPTQCAAAHD